MLDADRAAEDAVVGIIRNAFSNDAIIAEEGTTGGSRSDRRWYVDPLDGTVNYLYGLRHFAVAVGCEDADGMLVAAVFDPSRGELFAAVRGEGAWRLVDSDDHPLELLRDAWVTESGERLRVRSPESIGEALVATGFAYVADARAEQARILTRVVPHVRDIRRFGSAQLDLAYVAAGRYDAYFESVDKPWDWKAGALLVREAGGRVTELPQARAGHPHIAASAPGIHDALVSLLRRAVQSD